MPKKDGTLTKVERLKLAKELIDATSQPDWYETDPPEVIAAKRYAVTIERDQESWIDGVDSLQDVADIAHGCLTGPEYDVEWIDSVFDLETGERVQYEQTVVVVLKVGEGAHRQTIASAA